MTAIEEYIVIEDNNSLPYSAEWSSDQFVADQPSTPASQATPRFNKNQIFQVDDSLISVEDDFCAISDDEVSLISIDSQEEETQSTFNLPQFDNVVDLRGISEPLDLNPGDDVQLFDRSFLRIRFVTKDNYTRKVLSVSGYRLMKLDPKLHLMQPKDRELILIFHEEVTGFDSPLASFDISEVSRRCNIIFTNHNRADLSAQNDVGVEIEREFQEEVTHFCRWKRILPPRADCFDGRGDTRHYLGSIIRLQEDECDDTERPVRGGTEGIFIISAKSPARNLRNDWRGLQHYHPFGSKISSEPGSTKRNYTCCDFFCGGGGASCGAHQAGFALKAAVDYNREAIETYRKNFTHTGVFSIKASIGEFITSAEKKGDRLRCDHCHFSPPCTFASSANTRPNEELDADAHTAFLSIGHLLNITRPRIVTLEEAPALVWPGPRRRPFFTELIDLFISHGYSVRWKVQNLADWGVPQKRIRLIMIASCPGERLPSWPEPTHGESGPLPYVTLGDAFEAIPRDAIDHNPDEVRKFPIPKPALDWNSLSMTIKCSGDAENVYHPSGERNHTIAELKAIQTFPHWFLFEGRAGDKKRQIGNAFPPQAAKVLFLHLRKWLEEEDERELSGL